MYKRSSEKVSGFIVLLTIFFFLLGLSAINAQVINEKMRANHWHFGDKATLDFTSGTPVSVAGSQLGSSGQEGSASISDLNGNLLFYTDGETVWDRNHNIMPNGTGLLGDISTVQSAVIVPHPGQSDHYFIFTAGTSIEDNGTVGVRYTEVDMALNGGMGDVITSVKNILLFSPNEEKLTAVRNASSTGYWVAGQEKSSDKFYVYEVTAAGVNTTPVISQVGPPARPNNSLGMKFSPDGSMLATQNVCGTGASSNANLTLYGFDNSTGQLTYRWSDCGTPGFRLEFSPDASKLYAAGSHLYQYDLTAGGGTGTGSDTVPVKGSKTQLTTNTWEVNGGMQLAPDCKIYFGKRGGFSSTGWIGVIQDPNLAGTACNYTPNYLTLSSGDVAHRLTNFVQSFFEFPCDTTYFNFQNTCFNDTTFFSILAGTTPDSADWNFGDPSGLPSNTDTGMAPYHIFSSPGSYTVTLYAHSGGITDTIVDTVTITAPPVFNIGNDTTICTDSILTLNAPGGYTYDWDNGQSTNSSYNVQHSSSGIYDHYVTVTDTGGCTATDSIEVTVNSCVSGLNIVSSPDTNICSGTCINISAQGSGGTSPYSYSWTPNIGSGSGPHNVCPTSNTTYTVIVNDNGGASDTATITVTVNNTVTDSGQVQICDGQSATIHGNSETTAGFYSQTYTGSSGCDSTSVVELVVHNTYTDTVPASICQGDSLFAGGDYQNTAGYYHDTLSSSLGCDSIISTNLSVLQPDSSSATQSICQGDSIQIHGNYESTPGTYTAIYSGSNGCDSTSFITLNINPISNDNTTIDACQGDSVLVNGQYYHNNAVVADTLSNSLGCDSIVSTSIVFHPAYEINETINICEGDSIFAGGDYQSDSGTYTNNYSTAFGCDSTIITTLNVRPNPIANAGKDTTINIGNSITLLGKGGPSYSWDPPTGLSCSSCENPTASPGGDISYVLTVTNEYGCMDTDTIHISVDQSTAFYLPNIFSPNNDGNNDVFRIRGNGFKSVNMFIYNRWGQKVFETTDPANGWKGRHLGKESPTGVYVYHVYVEMYTGEVIEENGNVTLVR